MPRGRCRTRPRSSPAVLLGPRSSALAPLCGRAISFDLEIPGLGLVSVDFRPAGTLGCFDVPFGESRYRAALQAFNFRARLRAGFGKGEGLPSLLGEAFDVFDLFAGRLLGL